MSPVRSYSKHTGLLAFVFVVVACIAWAAVFWVGWRVWSAEDVLALQASDMEQTAAREASLTRLRTLVRETRAEREEMRERASDDLIHVVQIIEDLGNVSDVPLDVGSAAVEDGSDSAAFRSVSLVVRARGTFVALAHTVELLDTLPHPSELLQFQLEKTPGASGPWALTARIRVVVSQGNNLQ
ncbi:hypothetical protein A2673_02700 [Candidatus Kaiserbacteria bacterium RIFCSPHIGHO2_01_FULL_50_13]|uniref:Uncharacterized protein n=1 Tax=Candidatus Kaiserbacteria bacterium RIFCSPLOWO2_01_FULL_50_24 TaxID=1798507 RepID=A0A1F6ER68_9BACT|nr:MAG: hypothetical protein A2673_02700 [Candidatus Kaiserbacteria bacterium RIFCSPHIGHO2_01_FULL_50_13]OGG76137.1 MAG: hypothetical protein A3A34_01435 [Candidatus Kaiserbacteria bacterium RIFCSPLOWO2_01_FULL_50_24]OGG81186.1 MAG: hypothetical protein A3H74_01905 [Candidatus Kaiserbacteria bacterium RIFCSPLOWO2_02_FULL_51_13]